MNFIDEKFFKLRFHTWCSIVLMIGSFFLTHGIIQGLEGNGNTAEIILGGVLCVASIVTGAIPHSPARKHPES